MCSKHVQNWLCAAMLSALLLLGAVEANESGDYDSLTEDRQEYMVVAGLEASRGEYDPMLSRIAPSDDTPYSITKERLDEIRARLMYPYYDHDDNGGRGDLQENIYSQNAQISKQLGFLLPFFGFGLNYTWVSLNGYLGFSDAPFTYQGYPLTFPVRDWPLQRDPSFIGPFYSKCNIGSLKPGDTNNQQQPGVYWRLERDLPMRSDRMAVEIRERIKWDVREGMVGAEIFNPKHLMIVTWKNVTFVGGYANSNAKEVTNTFQLLVVTDEVRTYAIFNYEKISWTSHTEAGGSADEGQGGTPAFVGFNAGNGTRSFEYAPYSQTLYIRDLVVSGMANKIPGRHIFRIDEVILPGCCRREETLEAYPLTFAPENANMLGGTLINVTGPCFETSYRVECLFDTTSVEGQVIDSNTAVCITPRLFITGYVHFAISVNGAQYYWNGKIFIESPLTAPEGIWFTDKSYQERKVESFQLQWLAGNLTQRAGAQTRVHLFGYREKSIKPDLEYIGEIITTSNNDREKTPVTIDTSSFSNLDLREFTNFEMGLLMANLTQPEPAYGLPQSPQIWSRPIPLAWYMNSQWERSYGPNWPVEMCQRWVENDRNLRNFASETARCPCLLKQAVQDKGRFLPDFSCDHFGNSECDYHFGAAHCVRSALPNKDGAGQQCCYDRDGYLMMTADSMWGGNPHRAHNLGKTPFNEANKVPSLSHWYYDVIPFYTCCKWQSEQSSGCSTYRFERRAAQDCVGYQVPSVATVFGDPHIYTFDGTQYTFNGKGEFVLTRVDSVRHVLDVQGRFEQIDENYLGGANATLLTAVAARDNVSSVVEIRRRPMDAIWRYHLDVIVDGRRVYFDRYSQKIQQFKECVVYTPSNILNQSQVIVTFSSGAGVEVQENQGFLGMRVFLPLSFANITRGLLGNWSFDPEDDFVLPDGTEAPYYDTNNFKTIHENFGLKWVLDSQEDEFKGRSLFTHDNERSSNYYYDANFVPEYERVPVLNEDATTTQWEIDQVCGDSYQCNFDFVTTLRRDFAVMTKYYQDQFVNIKYDDLHPVISCGALPTPPHGRKSTFNFLSGAEVKFDCDPGYVLLGEQRRWCYASGDWNWPEDGEATCVSEQEYQTMTQGVVAGVVLAVLVPIIIAVVCFVCHLRNSRKNNEENDDEEFETNIPMIKVKKEPGIVTDQQNSAEAVLVRRSNDELTGKTATSSVDNGSDEAESLLSKHGKFSGMPKKSDQSMASHDKERREGDDMFDRTVASGVTQMPINSSNTRIENALLTERVPVDEATLVRANNEKINPNPVRNTSRYPDNSISEFESSKNDETTSSQRFGNNDPNYEKSEVLQNPRLVSNSSQLKGSSVYPEKQLENSPSISRVPLENADLVLGSNQGLPSKGSFHLLEGEKTVSEIDSNRNLTSHEQQIEAKKENPNVQASSEGTGKSTMTSNEKAPRFEDTKKLSERPSIHTEDSPNVFQVPLEHATLIHGDDNLPALASYQQMGKNSESESKNDGQESLV